MGNIFNLDFIIRHYSIMQKKPATQKKPAMPRNLAMEKSLATVKKSAMDYSAMDPKPAMEKKPVQKKPAMEKTPAMHKKNPAKDPSQIGTEVDEDGHVIVNPPGCTRTTEQLRAQGYDDENINNFHEANWYPPYDARTTQIKVKAILDRGNIKMGNDGRTFTATIGFEGTPEEKALASKKQANASGKQNGGQMGEGEKEELGEEEGEVFVEEEQEVVEEDSEEEEKGDPLGTELTPEGDVILNPKGCKRTTAQMRAQGYSDQEIESMHKKNWYPPHDKKTAARKVKEILARGNIKFTTVKA